MNRKSEIRLDGDGAERRLEFETLLADLSARFVAIPSNQVDDEIHKALNNVLAFFGIDRISLLRLLPGRKFFVVTHNSDSTSSTLYPLATPLPVSLFPYISRKLGDDHTVFFFNSLDELPEEALIDRQNCEKWGVQSGLYIPIAVLTSSEYTLGISSLQPGRMCPLEYVPRLRLLGELFVNVLERRQMETQLRDHFKEIEQLKLQLEKENVYLREEVRTGHGLGKIVGDSETLQYVFFRIRQVAPTDATVLILGETGTGKGLIAHAIHELSTRKTRPMVTVNCASLPASLIESELFGREKGAFTGADAKQLGRFDIAHGGTIFLDEIGELPLELQAKLLRVLQDGEFERLGNPKTVKVDVRVIAATSRDLKQEIRNNRFREDLFYRLNVFPVSIPPLRQRSGDVPRLVHYFVDRYARKIGRPIKSISKSTMRSLEEYPWPGNVRELEHVIERAVITSTGPLLRVSDALDYGDEAKEKAFKNLATMERDHILKALNETGWKIDGDGGAASLLGLHPSTLRFRLKKLNIERP